MNMQGEYKGADGRPFASLTLGNPDDPCVLLLAGSTDGEVPAYAQSIALAGRHVVVISMAANADRLASDIAATLSQFPSRPVLIADGRFAHAALSALCTAQAGIASGLVLIDPPASAASLLADLGTDRMPTLVLGAQNTAVFSLAAKAIGVERVALPDIGPGPDDDPLGAALVGFLERRVPRCPPDYIAGSDSRTLRDALGCFATGVTVVTTTDANGQPVGLTVNSFTSVSLDPELLLVCIARSAGSAAAFRTADSFAINVLHIGQQPTSDLFAVKGADRFSATEIDYWDRGVPILSRSLASFECARHAVHDGGDHDILVGRVVRVRYEPHRDPLLYFRGAYRRLHFA